MSIGFELPPNENPADFFLDIVSGCVPCQANPDFSTEVRNWTALKGFVNAHGDQLYLSVIAAFIVSEFLEWRAQDLYGIWEELGGAWAEAAATEAGTAGAADAAESAAVPELSPQQLQLVQEHFDRVPVCPWPLLVYARPK